MTHSLRDEPDAGPPTPERPEQVIELYRQCRRRLVELERALMQAQEKVTLFERVLDGIVDLLVVKDRAHNVVYANRAFCDYYGWSRDELLFGPAHVADVPEIAARHAEEDEHVLTTGNFLSPLPETIDRHDGTSLTFATIKSPIRDDAGSVDMVVSVSRNIVQAPLQTGEARRQSESHHNALLAVIPDLVFRVNREGVYLDFSAPTGAEAALPPALFLGKRMHDFLPELAPRFMSAVEGALDTGEMQTIEYSMLYRGETAHFEARVLASGADEAIAVVRDITAQKRAEEAQRRLEGELARAREQTLLELATPVIPIGNRVIVMPVVGDVDAERVRTVMKRLLFGVAENHARIAIVDVTGVMAVKPDIAGALVRCARAAQMLGARMFITGIRPEVARTLVEIDEDRSGIVTFSALSSGIALAMRSF